MGVLITRAKHQAAGLCDLIEQLDGRPICLPAIEILAPEHSEQLHGVMTQMQTFHMAIFVSANAVHWGLKQIPGGRLPERIAIAAVGQATAQALNDAGYTVNLMPQKGFDSEALLATSELGTERVTDKRILIFRGEDGRPLLGDTLVQRGAEVVYAAVYRRSCPAPSDDFDLAVRDGNLHLITATSNAILDNLILLFGEAQRERLLRTPLIVISARMRAHARSLGWNQVFVADRPDDQAIVATICRCCANS